MGTATCFSIWRGVSKSWTNSIGTIYIESAYGVYADLTDGTSNSYLALGSSDDGNVYIIRNYGTTNQILKDMLPIRLEITINGSTYNFSVSSGTAPSGSYGNYYFAINRIVSSRLVQMTIPKDGSEFTISTVLKIKYNTADEESFTFTQQACGTIFNRLSGEQQTLVTGRIYTYTLTNAATSTTKIKPLIRLGYYQEANKFVGTPSDPYINIRIDGILHSWKIADHWEIENDAFTEAKVAISGDGGSDQTIEGYTASYKITSATVTYYLRVCFTQYYTTSDFTSSVSGIGGIEIGNAYLNLRNRTDTGTVITGRDTADDDLRPQITGLTLTDSLRRDIDYRDWHGHLQQHSKTLRYTGSAITKYGNLVAGYSFCRFEPQIDWKFGDNDDNTQSTRTAKAFVNDEQSGEDIIVREGSSTYRIQYQVPDRATEQIRIEVTVTGSIWGLSSTTYTATYSTITYHDPQLQNWEMTRCTILYYQATDPSRTYTTEKKEHIGDLWYCTADITESGEVVYEEGKTYRMSVTGPTSYGWKEYDEEYTYFTYGNTRYVVYPQGNYVKIEFTASFSDLNGHNTEKVIYLRTPNLETYYPTGNVFTAFKVIALSANSSQDIRFELQDDLCGARAKYKHKAETIESVIDFRENSYAIGVGKISETDKMMDIRDGWTLRAYNVVIGGYTPPQIEGEPPPSARDQNLIDWMKNIESQLHDLENGN